MKKDNKKMMILVGILIGVIGISLAYYVANSEILGDNGSRVGIKINDMLRVVYDAGSSRLDASLSPGKKVSKGFKVSVTPTSKERQAMYVIKFNIAENTYEYCNDSNYDELSNPCKRGEEELVYRLKDNSGNILAEDTLMGKTGDIEILVENKEVYSKTDFNYIFEIEFKETNASQNHNQNKVLNGSIEVEFSDGYNADLNIVAINVESEAKSGKYKASDNVPTIGYFLNEGKSYCEVNGERVNNAKFSYNIEGTIGIDKITAKGTKCYAFFDKYPGAVSEIFANLGDSITEQTESVPDFASAAITNEGVFKTSDGMYGGDTYYFRGAVDNNHVIFADLCWKMIRINGDGSIRLIYNGTPENGVCKQVSDSTSIALDAIYSIDSRESGYSYYVGWTYTAGNQRPENNLAATPSNIKVQTESWYKTNITDKGFDGKVATGKFCNDRNVASGYSWVVKPSSTFYYAGYDRSGDKSASSVKPVTACPEGDVYEIKVGAITMDEVIMAGGKWGATGANRSYYLYADYGYVGYWTMTPHASSTSSHAFGIDYEGKLISALISAGFGIRPVINLLPSITFKTGGNGTANSPYIVVE